MPKPIFFCSLFSFCRESCEDWGVWIRARMAAGTPGLGGRGLPRCIYAYMLMSCFVSSVRSSLRFNVPVEIPDDHDGHDGLPVTMHCNVFIFTQPNTTVALNCYKMIKCSSAQLNATIMISAFTFELMLAFRAPRTDPAAGPTARWQDQRCLGPWRSASSSPGLAMLPPPSPTDLYQVTTDHLTE